MGPSEDPCVYGPDDAQLALSAGTPRLYIMRLPRRGLSFNRITYHARVTQCLGSITPAPWYMVVSAPSPGGLSDPPTRERLAAFQVPHGVFIKLHAGTWHAGPLFDAPDKFDFFNLELSDTNVVDHNTHNYKKAGMPGFVVRGC